MTYEDEYNARALIAGAAGRDLGATLSAAITELSAAMTRDSKDADKTLKAELDLTLRVNAITQLLVPIVDATASAHEAARADCFDECVRALLGSFLGDAASLALAQSAHNRKHEAQNKVAQALMDDADTDGSKVAEDAKRKLAELMATLGKGR